MILTTNCNNSKKKGSAISADDIAYVCDIKAAVGVDYVEISHSVFIHKYGPKWENA